MIHSHSLAAFRITRNKHSKLDGIGASIQPGRWNLEGQRVVYTAGNRALACLEVLVHLKEVEPPDYVLCSIEIPREVSVLVPSRHPLGSDAFMKALEKEQLSQQIGAAWYETRESAVLAVPSTIIRQEFNYLLNPLHPDFARIKVVSVEPYHFDARLWKQAGGRS